MSESICRFIPAKDYVDDLKTVHFVYETEHHTFLQPFVRPIYYLYLVTDGTATLQMAGREHRVGVGDLFIGYPACPYSVVADGSFRYLYISFFGSCVPKILERLGVEISSPVFRNLNEVTDIWFSAISRLNSANADFLSESVLLYTLSLFGKADEAAVKQNSNTMFEMICQYVDNHYKDPSLSLGSVASIFSYTENYLSSLFKKNMQLGFSQYVNRLRIAHALRMIEDGCSFVREIATSSGFSDALYFSKVFKKKVGMTPSEKIKRAAGGAQL